MAASRCGIAGASNRRRLSSITGADRDSLRGRYGKQYRGARILFPASGSYSGWRPGEAVEQIVAVHRPGRRFGMILHAEHVPAFDRDAAIGAVEQRDMGFLHALGQGSRSTVKPWFIDTISTLPVSRSFTGWLAP